MAAAISASVPLVDSKLCPESELLPDTAPRTGVKLQSQTALFIVHELPDCTLEGLIGCLDQSLHIPCPAGMKQASSKRLLASKQEHVRVGQHNFEHPHMAANEVLCKPASYAGLRADALYHLRKRELHPDPTLLTWSGRAGCRRRAAAGGGRRLVAGVGPQPSARPRAACITRGLAKNLNSHSTRCLATRSLNV